jgi:hypothetical protein
MNAVWHLIFCPFHSLILKVTWKQRRHILGEEWKLCVTRRLCHKEKVSPEISSCVSLEITLIWGEHLLNINISYQIVWNIIQCPACPSFTSCYFTSEYRQISPLYASVCFRWRGPSRSGAFAGGCVDGSEGGPSHAGMLTAASVGRSHGVCQWRPVRCTVDTAHGWASESVALHAT